MNRKEATEFVNSWLWNPGKMKRLTTGMPWLDEYKEDIVSMVMAATELTIKETQIENENL